MDEQLIAMLVDRARGDGLKLTGEGGLLWQLTSGPGIRRPCQPCRMSSPTQPFRRNGFRM